MSRLLFQVQSGQVGQALEDLVRELCELVSGEAQSPQVGQTLEDVAWELCELVEVEVQSGQIGQALEDVVWELCELVAVAGSKVVRLDRSLEDVVQGAVPPCGSPSYSRELRLDCWPKS